MMCIWLYLKLIKLLHNCEDHFHLHSLSTVQWTDLYHIHIMSFSSYNRYKLNSHLTCFQRAGLHNSVGRASHWYRGGHGFESRWSLRFFLGSHNQLSLGLLFWSKGYRWFVVATIQWFFIVVFKYKTLKEIYFFDKGSSLAGQCS